MPLPHSPVCMDATSGPWPLHDATESRLIERAALAAKPTPPLMELAGLAVARLALAIAPHARRVRVWAGPGNNGGDGLVAARHLHTSGLNVQVHLLGNVEALPADAAAALTRARAAGVPIMLDVTGADGETDLAIDALLGLGARRAPEGALAAAIAAMNAGRAPVVAVDLPSGLHPDTGTLLGATAVRAAATLCLLSAKPGCFTGLGREHAGSVWLDTLGVDTRPPSAWLSGPPAARVRGACGHKGTHGDVAVVGGAPGMTGAAWLAARAALAAGAGRVYCSPLDGAASLLDAGHAALMGRQAWWLSAPEVLASTTVACGCGGGQAVRDALPPLLSRVPRLVLDADALNAVSSDDGLLDQLRHRAARGQFSLLTPHPLEAARLLQTTAAGVQADRLSAAAALAERYACCVLLKGSGTIVAAPGEVPRINPTGNAALGTAGTGDVLAGWLAGLWAQTPHAPPMEVAAIAAWQHGRVADLWPAASRGAPMRADDLVEALAQHSFG